MKIIIKSKEIETCPILEVVEERNENSALPTVVYFHGMNNSKEKHLEQAYGLASEGFRVILPDAHLHGERKNESDDKIDPLATWEVVGQSLKDLKAIYSHYEPLIDQGRFAIAGESMGGVTSCCALTQFPFIRAAFIMMASPLPVQLSIKAMKDANFKIEEIESVINRIRPLDLSLNPEVMKGKSVTFWHDVDDTVMPYEYTKAWYDRIREEPFARKLRFITSHGEGHRVRSKTTRKMIQFMKENV